MEKCIRTQQSDITFLDNLVKDICDTYEDKTGINHLEGFNLPAESEILSITKELLEIVFPGFSGKNNYSLKTIRYNVGEMLSTIYFKLSDQIVRSLRFDCEQKQCKDCDNSSKSINITKELLNKIPEIRAFMKDDVAAAYDGDPAATSFDEIILSYPCIKAITVQRLAHVLYHAKVPLIPRMMTEYAHSITGIDIHPGAHLDKGVFIDHGTGVVIGETASIGENVKIYQGVTLGALSFPKDACGMIIKGAKRHPTIEKNVTIYSGASILGDIVVGEKSIIGGNVWLTESVPAETKITVSSPKQNYKRK